MGEAIEGYLQQVGRRWNRFWFTPREPRLLCVLRMLAGASAGWYLLALAGHLQAWFGPYGLLPAATVRQLTRGDALAADYHWSYLYSIDSSALLVVAHTVGLLVVLAFAAGLFTRVTSVLSFVIVLAYVHRGPMVAGTWEPLLTMMLMYLCLAPCGACLSLDRWLRERRGVSLSVSPSPAANVALRLMQVHLSAFYLMMGLTKLAGETWWTGDAVWWLMARTESRLVDFSWLSESVLLVNLCTHAIVLIELAFGVLIWQPLARPVLLAAAGTMWVGLALVTGQLGFCVLMLIANLCFLPAPQTDYAARGVAAGSVVRSAAGV